MENKEQYYTPEISDLYVGYECEKLFVGEYITKYYPYTIKAKELDMPNIYKTLDGEINNYAYRTKYLDKQDIQSENWVILKKSDNNYIHAEKDMPLSPILRYDMLNQMLTIYNKIDARHEILTFPAFYGYCPSINEFRKITKWIGIK